MDTSHNRHFRARVARVAVAAACFAGSTVATCILVALQRHARQLNEPGQCITQNAAHAFLRSSPSTSGSKEVVRFHMATHHASSSIEKEQPPPGPATICTQQAHAPRSSYRAAGAVLVAAAGATNLRLSCVAGSAAGAGASLSCVAALQGPKATINCWTGRGSRSLLMFNS